MKYLSFTVLLFVLVTASCCASAEEVVQAPTKNELVLAANELVTAYKDPLKNALVQLIYSTTETAKAASSFVVEQTPDVIRQLLVYKLVVSLAAFILGWLALIAVFMYWRLVLRHWAAIEKNDMEGPVIAFGATGSIFGIIFTCFNIADVAWLQIWLAPKVYLIEYAASLVK